MRGQVSKVAVGCYSSNILSNSSSTQSLSDSWPNITKCVLIICCPRDAKVHAFSNLIGDHFKQLASEYTDGSGFPRLESSQEVLR